MFPENVSPLIAGVICYLGFLCGVWVGVKTMATASDDERLARMTAIADEADRNPEAIPRPV